MARIKCLIYLGVESQIAWGNFTGSYSVPEWSPDRRTFPVIDNSVRKIVHQPRTACPDVKFGTNLDVLAEITVHENHYWKSDQSQDSLQNDQSTGYRSVSICKVFTVYLP